MATPYGAGFTTLDQELELDDLPVSGSIPDWLDGALIRNGPARFEIGSESFRHWFDGLAMLHRFGVRNGRVSYRNRFVQSRAYRQGLAAGRVVSNEFATRPRHSLWRRLGGILKPGLSDNANVHVTTIKSSHLTMGEALSSYEFDPETLATLGPFVFADSLGSYPGVRTAHPMYDYETGEYFNMHCQFGPNSAYVFFRVRPGGRSREDVAAIKADRPAYCHSFGMTPHHLVLLESPLRIKPSRLAWGGRPYIENFCWEPERRSSIILVERETGVVRRFLAPPLFAFHHINAFERNGEVLIDVAAYESADIVRDFYLENLRSHGVPVGHVPRPMRLTVPLRGNVALLDSLSDQPVEMPRLNEAACSGRPYRFVFGLGVQTGSGDGFLNQVTRIDVASGACRNWFRQGFYPGEPVFVPRPGASSEDDGVLLTVALDAGAVASSLFILDAATLAELARADLPHHVPFGFHGQFYPTHSG